jgi:uncharacterized LabA/DUF88 family protein
MPTRIKNYAFIDGQNLHMGLRDSGIALDFRKFRIYLQEKYDVFAAYYFIGYMQENQSLYDMLQRAGYVLQFKEVSKDHTGKAKGNVDVDLTLRVIDKLQEYDRAVLVTNDGDFASVVTYLIGKGKFEKVLSPNRAKCSYLLRKAAKGHIDYLDEARGKIERKK